MDGIRAEGGWFIFIKRGEGWEDGNEGLHLVLHQYPLRLSFKASHTPLFLPPLSLSHPHHHQLAIQHQEAALQAPSIQKEHT
jgi:hypothetical protein